MIYNSITNFNVNPSFKGNTKNEKETVEETKTDNSVPEKEEEYSFESTAIKNKKDDAKIMRNLLGGSLVALSMMSAPFIGAEIIDNQDFDSNIAFVDKVYSEEDNKLFEKADSLAKTTRNENVLDADEFRELLDYSALDVMPRLSGLSLVYSATSQFLPVNMRDAGAKDEIIKQAKNAQYIINGVAENYRKNPPKSYNQTYAEYVINNITPDEILDCVDFSELAFYQKDLSVTKGLIRFSMENIKREDYDADKKKEKEIQKAQSFVDGIVKKYKMRAQVYGNYNGDEVLTKKEFASLLNTQCLKDLPDEIAFRILSKALEDYKPIDTRYATDNKQIERTNEKVEENIEKTQKKLDEWAIKAQDFFFPILHPNEIKVTRKG